MTGLQLLKCLIIIFFAHGKPAIKQLVHEFFFSSARKGAGWREGRGLWESGTCVGVCVCLCVRFGLQLSADEMESEMFWMGPC